MNAPRDKPEGLNMLVNWLLLCANIAIPTLRFTIQLLEYLAFSKCNCGYYVFNSLSLLTAILIQTLHKQKKISDILMCFLNTELSTSAFLYLGFFHDHGISPVWILCSLLVLFLVQIPILGEVRWVKFGLCSKQVVVLLFFSLLTGQIIITGLCELLTIFAILALTFVASYVFEVEKLRMQFFLEELKKARSKLDALISVVPMGILVIDTEEHLHLANEGALRLLKCTRTNEVMPSIGTQQYIEDKRLFTHTPQGSLMDDITSFMTLNLNSASFGLTKVDDQTLEWEGSRVIWDNRPAVVVLLKDVTALLSLEQERVESQYKSVMLRTVSHELRTPTNGIMHMIEIVKNSPEIPAWAVELLDISHLCSKHLLFLINDLLDYSQLIAGRLSLAKAHFNVRDTLSTCLSLVRYVASKKRIRLVEKIDPLIPEMVYTDENRLSQVILNLLSNAVKFTPTDGRIELLAELNNQGSMDVAVRDSGIGINEEGMSMLFTAFGRVAAGASMNPQGCGLGLHISNMLVDMLGGSNIKVKTQVRVGSEFMFSCKVFEQEGFGYVTDEDLQVDLSPEMLEGDAVVVEESAQTPKEFRVSANQTADVLIVDDSPFNRLVATEILKTEGIKTAEAESGYVAFDLVVQRATERRPFQVVIMDYEMPGINGPETARRILHKLGELELAPPKIIAHTANTSQGDIAKCQQAGMVDFLPKPCTTDQLISKVKLYLV
jgi:signal transduction histidine kinase/CheY-like chemotaxis protein